MYLTSFEVSDLKCFKQLTLNFTKRQPDDPDSQSNWNVILGDNGYGKSTLLQALAVCLMNATTADRAAKPNTWIRREQENKPPVDFAKLRLSINSEPPIDIAPGRKGNPLKRVSYRVERINNDISRIVEIEKEPSDSLPDNAFTGTPKKGWISCGYGPFRRVYGFSNETITQTDPVQKRFITLFNEGASLFDCESWLKDLERKALKSDLGSSQRRDFEEAKEIICRLLPDIGKVTIEKRTGSNDDERVVFWYGETPEDADNRKEKFNLNELSDGYRSMFALAVDMSSWFLALKPPKVQLTEVSGVVLIDEIDAHLHPEWQIKVGYLLTQTFPNIQFIVATHSPYVAMAAGRNSLIKLEKEGKAVVARPQEYIRGWTVDQVLEQIFNVGIRDQDTTSKLHRYDQLTGISKARTLTPEEKREWEQLKTELDIRLAEAEDYRERSIIYDDIYSLIQTARAQKKG